ncbi:Crp/Fnr family transcriptional regulator [Flavobacteriaceae bacterium]|nr:Crp/Fnr family transcriptional regulator [Flavobacteriaceae bacterium]
MIDFNKIKAAYDLSQDLTLEDLEILLQSAKIKSLSQGECLITEGSVKKDIFFIQKGLVRVYKISDKGDEITTLIRNENQIIASPEIILFNQPSQFYYETMESTEVIIIDYNELQTIIAKYPKLEAYQKFVLQNFIKMSFQRINSFVLQSPEERYTTYVKSNPDIINRVPDKYIANILGITPVSLSRIRKRITTKKIN